MPTVPQSAYLSLLGSQIFPSNIANASQVVITRRAEAGSQLGAFAAHSKSYFVAPQSVEGERENHMRAATPEILDDHDWGEDENIHRELDMDDPEEHKETEQLPLTKDFIVSHNGQRLAREAILMSSAGYISRREHNLANFLPNMDDSDDMNGVDVEVSDVEKNQAQRSIRRSVVSKEKLNWSQQFPKGSLSQKNPGQAIDGIQKLFIDSTGASSAINALKSKAPQQNHTLVDLCLQNKELKFIKASLLVRNLKMIDLQSNKLQTIPEEIAFLPFLEKLKVDNNQLTKLPERLKCLSNLNTLTFSHNQIRHLPIGIEDLVNLEILLMNDNLISMLPVKIGGWQHLKKLFIHNNQLSQIPAELAKLQKLREFSSEWLIYMNPPMPKIIRESKGQIVIDQVKQFCRLYQPQHLSNSQAMEIKYRSFSDFILYFHMIKPQDINKLQFGPKRRSLQHQICINTHLHLLKDVTLKTENALKEQTSSGVVAQFIDLNARDLEGTVPICFAFRANNQDVVDYLVELDKVNLDIVSPKYGCPLHLCILKHKFGQALNLIEVRKVNPHILNPNGSNALHILFANYQFDDQTSAEGLALRIIKKNVNLNLVDNNGLTPLHVAIKKSQVKAIQFAMNHNNGQTLLSKFDFNMKGKKEFTPLHYAILKNNHEAFMFLITQCHSQLNLFALDESCRTPRGLALINSPFFKILVKAERYHLVNQNFERSQFLVHSAAHVQRKQSRGLARTMGGATGGLLHNTKSFDFNMTHKNMGKIGKYQNLGMSNGNSSVLRAYFSDSQPSSFFGLKHANISVRKLIKHSKKFHHQQYGSMQHFSDHMLPFHQNSRALQTHQDVHGHLKKEHGFSKTIKGMSYLHKEIAKSQQANSVANPSIKAGRHPFVSASKMKHANKNQITNESVVAEENSGQKVVNNIFISSLNINLNLNINISIPPSPRSTRNHNASYLESHHSLEENKSILVSRRKSKGQLSKREGKGIIKHEKSGGSRQQTEKNEDLSIIDDEMPIKSNQVNSNVKNQQQKDVPHRHIDLQGLINNFIQPEIYKSLSQQFNDGQANNAYPQSENNIFINFCQIHDQNGEETKQQECLRIQSQNRCNPVEAYTPDDINQSRNVINCNNSMFKNQSQILQEEPIHEMRIQDNLQGKFTQGMYRNQNGTLKNDTPDILSQPSMVFGEYMGQGFPKISDSAVQTQRIAINSTLEKNPYIAEYLILVSDSEPLSKKYHALYSGIAQGIQQVLGPDPHLTTTRDDECYNKLKELLHVLNQAIKSICESSGSKILLNDILSMMQSLVFATQHGAEVLIETQAFLDLHVKNNEAKKGVSILMSYEFFNSKSSVQQAQQQLLKPLSSNKYPKISAKLDQYLKTHKKNTFQSKSNVGSPRTIIATYDKIKPGGGDSQIDTVVINGGRGIRQSNQQEAEVEVGIDKQLMFKTETHIGSKVKMATGGPASKHQSGKQIQMLSHYKPESKTSSIKVVKRDQLKRHGVGEIAEKYSGYQRASLGY